MRAALEDGAWQTRFVHDGRGRRDLPGARPAAHDRRGDARLRRSGHAVRHHHQRLAHLPEHRPHQRVEPVLRVHAPRRLGLQSGVAQPDAVRRRRRATSTSTASATRSTSLITAQDIIVDNSSYPTPSDHGQRARLPRARPRLRQPRRAADVARPAVRLRRAAAQYAGAVTALMCGEAYLQSARIAGAARARSPATRRTASRCSA